MDKNTKAKIESGLLTAVIMALLFLLLWYVAWVHIPILPQRHDGHILQITLLSESFLQKSELEVRHPHEFPHDSLYLTRHLRILDKRKLGKHICDCLLP